LDADSKQVVFDVFSDPQLTILSVAHDPEWLERCGIVYELEAGRLTPVKHHGNP
ncbi:MAG: ABC transporter ATP-binding protein, partial [Methylobacter sp.]|nr:ABC transporter ATP-binding protein [Methylobacter sp.]